MDYNEQAALDFIRKRLPEDSKKLLDDDDILNVIDLIWDYYDENGYLDLDADDDDDDELDTEDLIDYVKHAIAREPESPLSVNDIETIVIAELDYEDTL